MLVKFTKSFLCYQRQHHEKLVCNSMSRKKRTRMNTKDMYQLFWFCVKTITSAPSRIVLVLKPLPSDTSNINSMVGGSRHLIFKYKEEHQDHTLPNESIRLLIRKSKAHATSKCLRIHAPSIILSM